MAFCHKIDNLAQHIYENRTSVTYSVEEHEHTELWVVECKINDIVLGVGRTCQPADAKEMAAEEAYYKLCQNYKIVFRQKLNNLAQHIFKNQTSVTYTEIQEEPEHSGLWSVECKINHTIYGTGRARKVDDAKEIASEEAWHAVRKTYNISDQLRSRLVGY